MNDVVLVGRDVCSNSKNKFCFNHKKFVFHDFSCVANNCEQQTTKFDGSMLKKINELQGTNSLVK